LTNAVDDTLYVDEAKEHRPSSTLAVTRSISKSEFIKLYPNYFKWRDGSMPREQAKGGSMNSSYVFALIHEFDK
jgi:hypothetical protein